MDVNEGPSEGKKGIFRGRGRRIAAGLGLAVLAAFLLFGLRFVRRTALDPGSAFAAPTPLPTAAPAATAAPTPTAAAVPTPVPTPSEAELLEAQAAKDFMQGRVNLLLLGYDRSAERLEEGSALYRDEDNNFRSDVMMLASIDFKGGGVQLISIPRDTMAAIHETTGRWKINAAFAKGGSVEGEGFLYAMRTVEMLLKIPVSHYAGVDMEGLKAVVDAMGGVDYEVDVRIELNGRVLEEGRQHLNGQQVLDYCRARKGITGTNSAGANSDTGRADRQQRMLLAIFEQLKSRDQLAKLPRIFLSVRGYIETDLSVEQVAALALFAQELEASDIERHTLPGKMVEKTSFSNASFYVLDTLATEALVKEIFGVEVDMDHRFGLPYVRAEKEAKRGRALLASTDHAAGRLGLELAGRYGHLSPDVRAADPLHALYSRSLAVQARCTKRPAWKDVDGLDKELNVRSEQERAAMEAENDALASALASLCIQRGLYASQLDKDAFEEGLYGYLKDYERGKAKASYPWEGLEE